VVNQPDPRLLKTFLVVAEELSFTRAAGRLHLVQQSVSAQIRALESQMGIRLFDRTTRQVSLTPAGLVLRDRAREAVLALDEAVLQAQGTARGSTGVVKAGHSTAAGWQLLPAVVGVLERTSPGLVLDSAEHTPVDLLDALRKGTIEVGVGLEILPCGSGLEGRKVWCEPWYVAVSEQHSLARNPSIKLTDLAHADWINWPRETHPGYWNALHAMTADAGFTPAVRPARIGIADYIRTIGNGAVGIGPASTHSHPLPGVVIVPIDPAPAPAAYAVVWNASARPASLDRILTAFAETAAVLAAEAQG
jgi:DNA-binding transcriptional LysR family regulator